MIKILGVFVFFLLVGSGLGYFVGLSDKTAGLRPAVTEYTHIKHFGKDNKSIELNYVCRQTRLASFNLDSGAITSPEGTPEELSSLIKPKFGMLSDLSSAFAAFVVGGGATKFGEPIFQDLIGKDKGKYLIAAAAGSLSGYYVGYRLGLSHHLSCDDPVLLTILHKESFWKYTIKVIATDIILRISDESSKTDTYTSLEDDVYHNRITSSTINGLHDLAIKSSGDNGNTKDWVELCLQYIIYIFWGFFGILLIAIVANLAIDAWRSKTSTP